MWYCRNARSSCGGARSVSRDPTKPRGRETVETLIQRGQEGGREGGRAGGREGERVQEQERECERGVERASEGEQEERTSEGARFWREGREGPGSA